MGRLLATCLLVLYCAHLVLGAAFTQGNILVTRSGDGCKDSRFIVLIWMYSLIYFSANTPSSTSNALFIDEYTTSGTLVQTISLS